MLGTKIYKPLQDDKIPVYTDVRYEFEDPKTKEKRVETRKEITSYAPNPAPNTCGKYTELANWCNANNAQLRDKGDYYECVANPQRVLTEQEKAEQRIAELKHNLNETDYISAKLAEGVATKEEYASELAQREAWRAEIRQLEAKGGVVNG